MQTLGIQSLIRYLNHASCCNAAAEAEDEGGEHKEYFRWTVVIPPDEVEKLGWEEGDELRPNRKGNKLVIKKAK